MREGVHCGSSWFRTCRPKCRPLLRCGWFRTWSASTASSPAWSPSCGYPRSPRLSAQSPGILATHWTSFATECSPLWSQAANQSTACAVLEGRRCGNWMMRFHGKIRDWKILTAAIGVIIVFCWWLVSWQFVPVWGRGHSPPWVYANARAAEALLNIINK